MINTIKQENTITNLNKEKLEKAHNNNIKISSLNLDNKFNSFETWEYNKSKRLLYEINNPKKRYKRYPRGSIVKVDFGVNIGSEFSEIHFAITLSKRDKMFNSNLIVVPLTSKKHKNTIRIDKITDTNYINELKMKLEELREEQDNKNLINNYKEIREIKKIIKYYEKVMNKFSYAVIDQIKTISKLNIVKPINKYDIVNNHICPKNVMEEIDKNIIKIYTSYDYREFDKQD